MLHTPPPGDYTRSGSMAPKKTTFKASIIEEKIGVNIELILTPIFYSILEAFNAVLLGAIEPERVYSTSS